MNDQRANLENLLPLLDMAFQAEQVKMAKVVARIEALKQQLRDLDRPTRAEPLSAAMRTGADLRWDAWAHDRKLMINQELAIASRDRERIKGDLIAALSKAEAAKRMQSRAKTVENQRAQRRSSW